ncbi:class I SAM-dependent methyltransferase [Seohaeicola nanhaiensis]|uniref:Class I SAM-dependent methyltransferase n=1 Tax=Seohaeicola nanhaiensis TaxID=1387282 RepID=A0ABV9KF68_9RHOB
MTRSILTPFLVRGVRMYNRITGRLPDRANWPIVWGNTSRFAADRWQKRDKAFERCDYSYSDAMEFLNAARPGAVRDIREGSIPEPALKVVTRHMGDLAADRPLKGLHIGNFVGVSLACITDAARKLHADSVVLSIDPNIPHRGIDSPQDLVTGLMARYGLLGNWMPVTGFTLDRSALYGVLNDKSSPTRHASYHGFSATQVLRNLARLGTKFDFVLIDGNHSEGYLRREVASLMGLVRPGGYLFFDDVDENWGGVMAVFAGLDPLTFAKVAHEGRIGVVRRRRGVNEDAPGGPGRRGGKGGGKRPGGPGRGKGPGAGRRRQNAGGA